MNPALVNLILLGAIYPFSFSFAQSNIGSRTEAGDPVIRPQENKMIDEPDAEKPGRTTVRAAFTYDELSKNLPGWREYSVAINHEINRKQLVELVATRTSRFDLDDNQIAGLYLYRFNKDLVASIEGNLSPTHRVLPKYMAGATVHYTFQPATVGLLGIKTTSYDQTRVNQLAIGVERYVGAFSVSGTWRPARAFGESIYGGDIRGSYYYGERSSIGVLVAAGEEVTPIGQLKTITRVRAAALIGQHWLNRYWAVTYAISHTRQGSLYDRTGFNVGLQYAL